MRQRIKKSEITPSSVKVFSTYTTPEEREKINKRVETIKALDAFIESNKTKHYYVRIFGKEVEMSLEEINKCGFKYYTK